MVINLKGLLCLPELKTNECYKNVFKPYNCSTKLGMGLVLLRLNASILRTIHFGGKRLKNYTRKFCTICKRLNLIQSMLNKNI